MKNFDADKICQKLAKIIEKTAPELKVVEKWGKPAYSLNDEIVFLLWPFTKHVSFTFYQGSLIKDRYKLFNFGREHLHNRTIKFTDVSQVNEGPLEQYIKEAVANAKKGKRITFTPSKNKTIPMRQEIKKILEKEKLMDKFKQRPFYQKRDYLNWVLQAKQEKTKQKRLNQMLEELRAGDAYMGMLLH